MQSKRMNRSSKSISQIPPPEPNTNPRNHFNLFQEEGRSGAGFRLDPGLTLVATPIGNLDDISIRALRALSEANIVLCEDTRISRKLISKYGISNKLSPYHEHNGRRVRPHIIKKLLDGARIVLICDSGTPTISDPGFRLVQDCLSANIPVSTTPGPTALIAALSISGLPTDKFYFGGFLPAKSNPRQAALKEIKDLRATLIYYESSHRLIATLHDVKIILGDRPLVAARELTKIHEEVHRGTVQSLLDFFKTHGAPKGEVVFLVGGHEGQRRKTTPSQLDSALNQALLTQTVRDAARQVSESTGVSRAITYKRALVLRRQDSNANKF